MDPIKAYNRIAKQKPTYGRRQDVKVYDPVISGLRRAVDQASGAARPSGIAEGEVGSKVISEARAYRASDIIKTGYRKSLSQFGADTYYARGAFRALVGDEEGARREVMKGVRLASEAENEIGALSMGKEWEKFLDEPTFEQFFAKGLPATIGEVGLSAISTITGALIGTAIATYFGAPAAVAAVIGGGGSVALKGAGGKQGLNSITKNLAFTHFTKKTIAEAMERAATGKALKEGQKEILEEVYKQYRKRALRRRQTLGAFGGITAAEFPRQTGTGFRNFADQNMYDPVSAGLSIGQGAVGAVIGGATETLVLPRLLKSFRLATTGRFKSKLTPAGQGRVPIGQALKPAGQALGISVVGEPITEIAQTQLEVEQKLGTTDPRNPNFGKFDAFGLGSYEATPENVDAQLDKTYTLQQANLDRQIAALAGFSAGGVFGMGGAISVGAVSGAQNLLTEYQQNSALASQIYGKYGPLGTGVVLEPEKWLRGQLEAMLESGNDKNSVWVDINSLDVLKELEAKNPDLFKGLARYDMTGETNEETQLGGVLFSTDPDIVQGFQQVMENNMPSAALLDSQLARILKYPRSRNNSDEWVVQVRNKKTGALVHYHQTGEPDVDGNIHLELAKRLFPDEGKYTYEIVEAQAHLDERLSLVTDPEVDLSDVGTVKTMGMLTEEQAAEITGRTGADFEGMTGLRDETGRYAQIQDVDEDGVEIAPQPVLDKDGNPEPSILNRNERPWTRPNPAFREDQMPSDEQINNARLATDPAFRSEFDENIKAENYSKNLLSRFIELTDTAREFDQKANTQTLYRIEPGTITVKNPKTNQDEEVSGYVINKYNKRLEKLESMQQAKPELDQIIRNAKAKSSRQSGVDEKGNPVFTKGDFTISFRDKDGNYNLPQPINILRAVMDYRNVLNRAGVLPNQQYMQSITDSFISLYGTIEEDPDYKLFFKGQEITDQSLRDPDFIIYSEEKGAREMSFADMAAAGAEESLGISEIATNEEIAAVEEKIEQKTETINNLEQQIKDLQALRDENGKFTSEQYNEFMSLINELYGPKVGAKRNGPLNQYIQRNELQRDLEQKKRSQGTDPSFDPRTDIEDTTGATEEKQIRGEDGILRTVQVLKEGEMQGDFQSDTTEQGTKKFWDAEYEHYRTYPFTKKKLTQRQETKTVEEEPLKTENVVTFSKQLEQLAPKQVKAYYKEVGKIAKRVLGLKKPILLFTKQETIDLRPTIESDPRYKKAIERYAEENNLTYEEVIEKVNTQLNETKDLAFNREGIFSAGYMQGVFKAFDIIVLNTPETLTDFDFGFGHLVLGHEIAHSFYKEQMSTILKNPLLRRVFNTQFEKAKKALEEEDRLGHQYFEENGFEEWMVDKISRAMFDLEKGVALKAENAADTFINNMSKGLYAFYNARGDVAANVFGDISQAAKNEMATFFQGRFTYDETIAELVKGLAEKNIQHAERTMSFTEKAHAEELVDGLFGNKVGIKFLRRVNKDAEKIIKRGELPSWFARVFYTARGFLDTLGKDKGIGKEIGMMFHKVSGEQGDPGFINEANRLQNELVNDLVKRLGKDEEKAEGFDAIKQAFTGVTDSSFTQEEIDAFREAQDESKPTEALSPKAQAARQFLFDLFDKLNLGQYDIITLDPETGKFKKEKLQRRPNFFPRIILIADIASDPKIKAKLIELLIDANPQMDPKDVVASVEELIKNNESSLDTASRKDEDSGLGLGMPEKRSVLFANLDTPTLVKEGIAAPGEVAIIEYIRQIARQTELQKRGGSRRIKNLIDKLPKNEQGHAKAAVNAMLGRIDPIRHSAWRHINDGVLFTNVITLLGMAVFASVPDGAGPVIRSREFDLKTIAKNLTAAMTKKEAEKFARDIGANGREAMAQTILYAGELDGAALWAKKATNGWFRFTQLERWTVFTRKFAAGMARDFLLKHMEIVENGYEGDADVLLSERYLKDLGVTSKQIKAWKDNGSDVDQHPQVASALGRFVDESIVRPNAAERPIWASDPHYAIVWQLKSFYYAYGKNIMGGMFREGKQRYKETGNIVPAIYPLFFGAALIMPLTMLGWDIRERFKIGLSYALPGVSPNDPGVNYRASRNMSTGRYWFEVMDRSGMMGAPALALPLIMEEKQYGKGPLIPILGPGAERAYDLLQGEAEFFDYTPIYSQLDTRALER
jgi:hypothetical protein|tara:strand:+ start:853 stop:7356 length:6504 start_codon:yes stop_codon:yes gene_type:complete